MFIYYVNTMLFIKLDHNDIIKELQKLKVSYITYMDSEYPVLLKEIYQFPLLLFYKGNIKLINNMHHLAVVGARDSTSYTQQSLEFYYQMIKQIFNNCFRPCSRS